MTDRLHSTLILTSVRRMAVFAAMLVLVALFSVRDANANVSLPSIFGDHMVLQRDMARSIVGHRRHW